MHCPLDCRMVVCAVLPLIVCVEVLYACVGVLYACVLCMYVYIFVGMCMHACCVYACVCVCVCVCVHLCVGGWCMHAMCVCERGRGILFHSTLHTCTYQIMYCYSRKQIIAMFASLILLSRSVGALFSLVICVVKLYQTCFLFLDGKK